MRKRILLASCLCVLAVTSCTIPDNKGQIWNIGVPDSSTVVFITIEQPKLIRNIRV